MALSEQDKDWVKLVAKELAFEVNKEVMATHVTDCPVGKKVTGMRNIMLGIGIGLGLTIGGGSGWELIKNIIHSLP
jgi:hypothetical protein